MLSTFEFWLELNTKGVKVKHCWVLLTNFLFSVQYKADSKQNMVFSVLSLADQLNGCKNSNFFTLPNLDEIPLRPF